MIHSYSYGPSSTSVAGTEAQGNAATAGVGFRGAETGAVLHWGKRPEEPWQPIQQL
jgi:hypothetical protein